MELVKVKMEPIEVTEDNTWNKTACDYKTEFVKIEESIDTFSTEELVIKEENHGETHSETFKSINTNSEFQSTSNVSQSKLAGEAQVIQEGLSQASGNVVFLCFNNSDTGTYSTQPCLVIPQGNPMTVSNTNQALCLNQVNVNQNVGRFSTNLKLETSDEKSYECLLCEYRAIDEATLSAHFSSHTGGQPHESHSEFITKSATIRHIQTDTGESVYECRVCKHRSHSKATLFEHVGTHVYKIPYECHICEYKGARRSDLTKHLQVHKKSYLCPICDHKCLSKRDLSTHIRTHPEGRPFSCQQCHYKFPCQSALVTHLRTHTGEKPFECYLCDEKYAYKKNLVSHIRTHTCKKIFSCHICDKKFASDKSLVRHIRTHNGEKP